MSRQSLLVILTLAALGSVASAQPGAMPADSGATATSEPNLDELIARAEAMAPSVATVARGTFRRARRAVSIGPTIGAWGTALIDPGDTDMALTFGIGIETFKVPIVPSIETVKALITERVKAQLKQRIQAVFAGRQPNPLELSTLAAQVYTDVRDEVLGVRNARAKTMERPQYTFAVEANRLFGAERWLVRTRVGIGVWKLTLGISAAVGRVCRGGTCDDGVKLFSGPELVAHFLTSKNPRASVVDAFLRFDFQATGRGVETYDQAVLGARFLLDVF